MRHGATFKGQEGTQRTKRVAFYARVSTGGQTVENQLLELRSIAARHGWDVVATYVDKGISGTKGRKDRPQYDALGKAVTRKDIDLVAAWSMDRLGRSLQDLVEFLNVLREKNVDLYLHQQALDTTTATGRAMFQLLGVFGEYEAAIIKERIYAGLARARKQGTASGRPIGRPRIPPQKEAAAMHALLAGQGILKTARDLGIGTGTVQRVARSIGRKRRDP